MYIMKEYTKAADSGDRRASHLSKVKMKKISGSLFLCHNYRKTKVVMWKV